MIRRLLTFAFLAMLLPGAAACKRASESRLVTIVTTPAIAGMGIDEAVAETFSREGGIATRIVVTDESRIPALVSKGAADVVITRSPNLRRALESRGDVRLSDTFAYDDFLLLGPKGDPARVKRSPTAADALRTIVRADAAYCSPIDVPDIRQRESEVFAAANVKASDDRRLRQCRGSAADVVREASRRSAYTLTDRATYENAGRPSRLFRLLEGTPMLHNDYVVLLVAPPKKNPNADWFVQWLMSYRGRETIENFRFDGERRLFVTEQ